MANNPNILQGATSSKLQVPAIKDIHVKAEELIQRSVDEFENDLRLQANLLAKDDEIILTNHVKASLVIIRKEKTKKWVSEILILFGGAFFGAGIAGFVNEISMPLLRPFWITAYVILGVLGLILIFIAYMSQYSR